MSLSFAGDLVDRRGISTFEELLVLSAVNGTQPFSNAFLIPRTAKDHYQ